MKRFIFDASKETPESVARRRKIAEALMGPYQPRNVGEGLSAIGAAFGSRIAANRARKAEQAGFARATETMSPILSGLGGGSIFGGGGQPSPSQPAAAPSTTSGSNSYRDAIASIESAGSGDYTAVGPTHPKLGRALGRYQIMEANIGPWSREVLGREVTPQEFMENPQLQDAIFDGKFNSYVEQYGPEGAAQAWFAGPGGVGKTNRQDVLGTNVGEYGQKFLAALGDAPTQPQPVQTASIGTGSLRDSVRAMYAPQQQSAIPPQTPQQQGAMPQQMPPGHPQQVAQVQHQQQPVQQQGGGIGLPQLLKAAQDPWVAQNPLYSGLLNELIGIQLKQQMPMSPQERLDMQMKQAELEKTLMEVEQMRNPRKELPDSVLALDERAARAGLKPGTPEYNDFMISGGKGPLVENNIGQQGTDYGDPPTNHAWARNQDGTVRTDERGAPIALPVGPALAEQQAEAASAEARQGVQAATDLGKADTMLNATSSIQDLMKDAELPVVGTLSRPFAMYSGTAAGKVRSYVRELQSGVALNAMMRLKEASAQGATGFGAMNAKELQLLIDDVGALDPDTTDPEIFQKTIERIENRFNRVVEDVKRNVPPEKLRELGLDVLIEGLPGSGAEADDPLGNDIPPAPDGVDLDLWRHMTPEERALWQ